MTLEIQNKLINYMNERIGKSVSMKELFEIAGATQGNDEFVKVRLLVEKLEEQQFIVGNDLNGAFSSEEITIKKEIKL